MRIILLSFYLSLLMMVGFACGGSGGSAGSGGTGGAGGTGGTGGTGGNVPNPKLASLQVDIEGLPAEAEASVTVIDPEGFGQTLTQTSLLEGLTPGSYEVEASEVESEGTIFLPAARIVTVELEAGKKSMVSVSYEEGSWNLQADDAVIPLGGSAGIEVKVSRSARLEGDLVLRMKGSLPKGIHASTTELAVPKGEPIGIWTFESDATVEALDRPFTVVVEGTLAGETREIEIEVQVRALVTNAEDSGPGSLREMIALAPEITTNPTIRFDPSAFYEPTTILLNTALGIDADLKIEGLMGGDNPLISLDPAGQSRVFEINGGEVRLSRLLLTGGHATAGGGGCAIIESGARATLDQLVVQNCKAGGGAGLIVHDGGTLHLKRSLVTENTASHGAGLASYGDLIVEESRFLSNHATLQEGGAIRIWGGSFAIIDSTFEQNQATTRGGAMFLANAAIEGEIRGSTFKGNQSGGEGGALYISRGSLTIDDSHFDDNLAGSHGGGLFALNGTLEVKDSRFTSNQATEHGGALVSYGVYEDHDSRFALNKAGGNGGAIRNHGKMTLTGTVVEENEAGGNCGGVFHAGSNDSTIVGSFIRKNQAGLLGGGIYNYRDRTLLIESTIIEENESTSGGGGVYGEEGGSLLFVDSMIRSNSVTNQGSGGGILNLESTHLDGSTVDGNILRDGAGGGIYSQTLTMNRSTVSRNAADIGGGIYTSHSAYVMNSTVSGNSAQEGGGILAKAGSALYVEFATVADNSASYAGGIGGTEAFLVLRATLLAGNHGDDAMGRDLLWYRGDLDSRGYNLIGVFTNSGQNVNLLDPTDQHGTLTSPLDPRLGPLAGVEGSMEAMEPFPTSHAVDVIPASECTLMWVPLQVDQWGTSRPQGQGCDIGAIEKPLM